MTGLEAAAEFVRVRYPAIIFATVGVGLGLGFWTTAPGLALQPYSQTLTFLMVLFISLTITPRQFIQVSRQPGSVAAGLALNFFFMPVLCWALALVLVPNADLATGVILIGVVPCAGMAAVWTALLKGDVPLGMAINGLTMVLGPFLIPVLMVWLAASSVPINPWGMFQQLAIILLAPLALGMGLRWLADRYGNSQRVLPLLPALSALTAALLMFIVCNVNVPNIATRWRLVPPLVGALALVFLLGFLIPHHAGRLVFAWPQRVAVTYSAGMKNLPIAVGLAFTSFKDQPLVGLPVVLGFILQMITASLFYRYLGTRPSEGLDEPNLARGQSVTGGDSG